MMRAFGLPHFGQTSRCGTVIFGVLLRFWRRSAGIDSGCIGLLLIISNRKQPVAQGVCARDRPGCWAPQDTTPFLMTLHAAGRILSRRRDDPCAP